MKSLSYSDTFMYTPLDVRDRMAESITNTLKPPPSIGANRICRIAFPVNILDPLAWLSKQEAASRFFWQSRNEKYICAGVGIADEIESLGEHDLCINRITTSINDADPDIRYLGGMRFTPGVESDLRWAKFKCARFVVPRFEISRRGSRTIFACHLKGKDSKEDVLKQLEKIILNDTVILSPLPRPTLRGDFPDRNKWTLMLDDAIREIQFGELEKIVLARRVDLTFDDNLDPIAILLRLREVTPQCYHFCFQPDREVSFIGASPERFYSRHGRNLESEAVAGTRPRGDTPSCDAKLSNALLSSDKDLREHGYVRDMIQNTLRRICTDLITDSEVSLLKLARGQHLFTGYIGKIAESISDSDLCRLLHPTPAVGGCPSKKAIVRIREIEGFDRGWYAAPFGSIGKDVVELAVAIRSALITKRRLSLFSGAGIVIGSKPEQEWEEVENKIIDFLNILTMSS